MPAPTANIYRNGQTGMMSLIGFGDTHPHRDTFRSAGYSYGEHASGVIWHIDAAGQADLARLIVASADAGIAIYQGNRTTQITAAQVEQARKQLAGAR